MNQRSKIYFKDDPQDVELTFFDFFRRSNTYPINYKNFPQEYFSIIAIFGEDSYFNLKEIRADWTRLWIRGNNSNNSKSNELMLRVHGNKLIVARIEFIHQRKGNMTRLYNILKQIKRKYKLEEIIIEQCHTEAITNWCIKNGMVPTTNYSKSFTDKNS